MNQERIYFTGFADEAAKDIDGQIRVTKELGWSNIESRCIDGVNIHDLSDEKFNSARARLEAEGVTINCFGSTIANWATRISEPFEITLEKVNRTIPRMHALGTQLIRIMSYAFPAEGEDPMEQERFRRLREITAMFLDAGITPVHENCMNYGGLSWKHTMRMLDNVPDLKLVFDTGNPVFNLDRSKPEPYPYQSSREFYLHVRDHIAYIHIKDGRMDPETEECIFTMPGEGDGDVEFILTDLISRGYSGGISIEPHMAAVFHSTVEKTMNGADIIYIEYGRKLTTLLKKAIADQGLSLPENSMSEE